jgi:hypothetical protein
MCTQLFLCTTAALALTVTAGACGSRTTNTVVGSYSTAARSTGMTKQQAAKAYLAALPPYRAALFAFDNTVGQVLGSSPSNKSVAIAKPLTRAITMLDDKLLRPGENYRPAVADIKNLVAATTAFKHDLDSISAVTARSARAWAHKEMTDRDAVDAASAIVRSDLGLPRSSGLETAKL